MSADFCQEMSFVGDPMDVEPHEERVTLDNLPEECLLTILCNLSVPNTGNVARVNM